MQSLYSAASGLTAQQTRLDTIASNISNANTPGFKATRTDFKDALYRAMLDPELLNAAVNNLEAGSGVVLDATALDMHQGTVVETGLPLDFAIEGDGFFRVQDQSGEILYTRSGSFTTTQDGGNNYLVTQEGYYVLDAGGNRLNLPADAADLKVTEDGTIGTADRNIGRLGIVRFTNTAGLAAAGLTCYRATAASGAAAADTASKVTQGSLERSNVDMSQEMTLLIRSQRAYSLASRAVTTTDDMMGLANNMHG